MLSPATKHTGPRCALAECDALPSRRPLALAHPASERAVPTTHAHARHGARIHEAAPPRSRGARLTLRPSAATVADAVAHSLRPCLGGSLSPLLAPFLLRPDAALESCGCNGSVTCALTQSLHDALPGHEAHWPTLRTGRVRCAALTKAACVGAPSLRARCAHHTRSRTTRRANSRSRAASQSWRTPHAPTQRSHGGRRRCSLAAPLPRWLALSLARALPPSPRRGPGRRCQAGTPPGRSPAH